MRDIFNVLPYGDMVKCIVALAESEEVAREFLLSRITCIDEEPGHTSGNTFFLGLEKLYGNLNDAIQAFQEVYKCKGKVEPVALESSSLCAKFTNGSIGGCEVSIDNALREGKSINQLFLDPSISASPKALSAVQQADVITIGPGSLYTSILPNLLPRGMKEAVQSSEALLVLIMNLMTEGSGMRGVNFDQYVEIIEQYTGRPLSAIICNSATPTGDTLKQYKMEGKKPLTVGQADIYKDTRLIVSAPLWQSGQARHNPSELAYLITGIIAEKLGF
jgi:uncharacterized cofD-like protein